MESEELLLISKGDFVCPPLLSLVIMPAVVINFFASSFGWSMLNRNFRSFKDSLLMRFSSSLKNVSMLEIEHDKVPVEHTLGQLQLLLLQTMHTLLNRAVDEEFVHSNSLRLSHTMYAVGRLQLV